MNIPLDKDLWIKNFEEIASKYYTRSLKAKTVNFILDGSVEKADSFSIMLLFGWLLQLAKIKNNVIEFSFDPNKMNDRLSKLLFGTGIIDEVKSRGVKVKEKYHVVAPPNYTVKILKNSENDLENILDEINNNFEYEPYAKFIINDLTNIVIREIISNSFIHQKEYSDPFLFITDRKIDSKISSYYLNSYDPGDRLLEIHIGDIGEYGIQTTLEKSFPIGWRSPLINEDSIKQEEMVILYAFDFSSTSNETSRKDRIQKLIKDTGIEIRSNEVASGLYSMLGVVKKYGGQFILKSSEKVLAFDFNNSNNILEIKGFKGTKYDIKKCSKISGTYFKIIVPINKKYDIPRNFNNKITIPQLRKVKTLDFRSKQLELKNESEFIPYFIKDFGTKRLNASSENTFVLLDIDLNMISSKGQQIIFLYLLNQFHNKTSYFINTVNYAHISYYDELNVFKGNKIFIGNADKNSFDVLGASENSKVGVVDTLNSIFTLDEQFLIRSALIKSWETKLQEMIESTQAKRVDGPFLFEELHYYTKEFYQLDFLFENPLIIDLLSSILSYRFIQANISLVVFEAKGFRKILTIIQDKLRFVGNNDIKLLYQNQFLISQTIDYSNKKAVVITDVICTGKTIKKLLSNLAHIEKLEIFTLIDGREKRETFSFDFDGTHYAYNVNSILHHFIKPYYEHPYSGAEKERIVLVNQEQKIPTIRERYRRPKDTEQEIEPIKKAVEAESLVRGHIEFRDKHYSYYIHFPSYFKFIEKDLIKWLSEQLNTLKTSFQGEKVTICLFEDISLNWLERFLLNELSDKEINFEKVNHVELYNPEPEIKSSENRDWIAFLPAISSGDTQMKLIEWISRFKPESIHLFSFVSRMNWYTANFYTGISHYHGIRFSLSYFTQFQVRSHKKNSHDCPYCSTLNILQKLNLDPYQKLKVLTLRRINKLNVININNTDTDKLRELTAYANEEDKNNLISLIEIRALYESAINNYQVRKHLYKKLKDDDFAKYSFIENLTDEYSLPLFDLNVMKDVLYDKKGGTDVFKSLQVLCDKIIHSKPPFQIRKYLLGVEHLVPNILYDNIGTLLQAYSNSPLDFEEIIYSILLLQKGPTIVSKLTGLNIDNKESKNLLKDLIEYFNNYQLIPSEKKKNLELIQKIYAKIYRSSFPMISVKNLILPNSVFSENKWQAKLKEINEAYRNWSISYEEWKPTLKNSTEVQVIDKYIFADNESKNTSGLEGILNEITTTMNQLIDNANKVIIPISNSQKQMLILLIDRIESYGKTINKILYDKFVVVPSKMNFRDELFKSKKINQIKDFDNTIDRKIFFTEAQLQYIIDELLRNCEKHFSRGKGSYIKIVIRDDDEFITLEIEDDISDDFKVDGIGSLNSIKDLCIPFGAEFKIIPYDEDVGNKRIELSFLKWPLSWER